MKENKFYGIKTEALDELNSFESKIEEIKILGYTIIEDFISEEEIIEASSKLDDIYDIQLNSFGKENLEIIKELNLVRSPLVYDDLFLKICTKPELISIVKYFLGDYFIINQQNGIINTPNQVHHQSSWHRDLPYQDYIISQPIGLSALCCIDDFNEQTGGTFGLPYSHLLSSMPSNNFINKHKVPLNAKKGSLILFNAMLYHQAGYNSSNNVRRGLNTLFTIPLIAQQMNLSKQMNGKFSDDTFLRKLIGYEINYPDSVDDWRMNRLNR